MTCDLFSIHGHTIKYLQLLMFTEVSSTVLVLVVLVRADPFYYGETKEEEENEEKLAIHLPVGPSAWTIENT